MAEGMRVERWVQGGVHDRKVGELEERIRMLTLERNVADGACAGYRQALERNRATIQRLEEELRIERQVGVALDSEWVPTLPRPVPPQLQRVLQMLVNEYWRAKDKHGEMTMDGTMTGNPAEDTLLRLAALAEEFGEVAQELTYDKGTPGALVKELIQVANVAATWGSYLVKLDGDSPVETHGYAPSFSGMTCGAMVMRDGGGDQCGEARDAAVHGGPQMPAEPTCCDPGHPHRASSCEGPEDELVPLRGVVIVEHNGERGQAEIGADGKVSVEVPTGGVINLRMVESVIVNGG